MKKKWKVREDGLGWKETPMKVVGHPRRRTLKATLQWNESMLRLSPMFGRWFPRGVYRFRTWEDLEKWEQRMRARPRK